MKLSRAEVAEIWQSNYREALASLGVEFPAPPVDGPGLVVAAGGHPAARRAADGLTKRIVGAGPWRAYTNDRALSSYGKVKNDPSTRRTQPQRLDFRRKPQYLVKRERAERDHAEWRDAVRQLSKGGGLDPKHRDALLRWAKRPKRQRLYAAAVSHAPANRDPVGVEPGDTASAGGDRDLVGDGADHE